MDGKARPQTLSSRLFITASASPAALPPPSLKSFGRNQMPIGQSLCCLALHSIQTSKPGASLGPSDLLREVGQSPAKCDLFSYSGCVRSGLQPNERRPGSASGSVRGRRAAGTLELTVPNLSIIQRRILRAKRHSNQDPVTLQSGGRDVLGHSPGLFLPPESS